PPGVARPRPHERPHRALAPGEARGQSGRRAHPRDAGRAPGAGGVRVHPADADHPRRHDRRGAARGLRARPRRRTSGRPLSAPPAMDPVIDATVRAALALLLSTAALHKVRDPARFRATVADYRLLPPSLVTFGATILVLSELAVAVA